MYAEEIGNVTLEIEHQTLADDLSSSSSISFLHKEYLTSKQTTSRVRTGRQLHKS